MKFLNLELQVLLDCLRVVVYGGVCYRRQSSDCEDAAQALGAGRRLLSQADLLKKIETCKSEKELCMVFD